LIGLSLLLILAAGLMTAIFISRHQTPAEFAQATGCQLPCDEAAHFEARSEWWYYTGFLTGKDGQRYAFELVFFKIYVPPEFRLGDVFPLYWVSNPLYFAHFAVSDQAVQEHVFFERVNFPLTWTAGAHEDQYKLWHGDWQAWGDWWKEDSSQTCQGEGEHHLQAGGGRYALRLDLEPTMPPVPHGPGGKCVIDMGQAGKSNYYSYPEMKGEGLLYVDGEPEAVEATVWMDHQWGSWDLYEGFAGWDWFSLRLDDGKYVMLYDFRDEAGNVHPESSGTWIAADGTAQHLVAGDYTLDVLERWTSPDTGATYPVKWHLSIPNYGVDATVEATFPEQEMAIQLGSVYWEGSVTVAGTVDGVGFVEMNGY
jgi:predicted secreted hydrolase